MFVCKTDFALFVPIEAVIPEKDFDENPVNARSTRTSEREEQIRKDELQAKSFSYGASPSGNMSSDILIKKLTYMYWHLNKIGWKEIHVKAAA